MRLLDWFKEVWQDYNSQQKKVKEDCEEFFEVTDTRDIKRHGGGVKI